MPGIRTQTSALRRTDVRRSSGATGRVLPGDMRRRRARECVAVQGWVVRPLLSHHHVCLTHDSVSISHPLETERRLSQRGCLAAAA
jgi:hypothetical protein